MTPEQTARWHSQKFPPTQIWLMPGPWFNFGDGFASRAAAEIVTREGAVFYIRVCAPDWKKRAASCVRGKLQDAIDDAETTLRHMGWTLTAHGAAIEPTLDLPSDNSENNPDGSTLGEKHG